MTLSWQRFFYMTLKNTQATDAKRRTAENQKFSTKHRKQQTKEPTYVMRLNIYKPSFHQEANSPNIRGVFIIQQHEFTTQIKCIKYFNGIWLTKDAWKHVQHYYSLEKSKKNHSDMLPDTVRITIANHFIKYRNRNIKPLYSMKENKT